MSRAPVVFWHSVLPHLTEVVGWIIDMGWMNELFLRLVVRDIFMRVGSPSGPRHDDRVETAVRPRCTAFPLHHQHSKPRPCRMGRSRRGGREASPSLIGPATCRSTLIPDTLTEHIRRWAGAAKKIIRSFELRFARELTGQNEAKLSSPIATMNGWWSQGQSRIA